MHIDFSIFLLDLVRREFPALNQDQLQRLARIPSESCPDSLDEILGSPLVFKLAQIVATEGGDKGLPCSIAQRLLDRVSENTAFFCRLGGEGYINAVPSPSYCRAFLTKIVRAGASCLLTSAPLGLEEAELQVVQRDFRPIILEGPLAEKLCKRAMESGNSDLEQMLAGPFDPERISPDDLVMCLALLADAELDGSAYQMRLANCQNIPWFFRKFFQDSRSFVENAYLHLGRHRSDQRPQLEITEICCGMSKQVSDNDAVWNCDRAIELWIKKFFDFRQMYFTAAGRGRADLIMSSLLEIVRDFYSFYNHPEVRAYRSETCSDRETMLQAVSLITVGVDLVHLVLTSLLPQICLGQQTVVAQK